MIWDCPNSSRTAQKVRLGMWAVVEKSRRNRGIGLSMIIKSSTVSSLYGILTKSFWLKFANYFWNLNLI